MNFGKNFLVIFSLAFLLAFPALAGPPLTGPGAYIASKYYVDSTKENRLSNANAGNNITITRGANDKIKISATDTHVPVDTALSTTSANPVQNQAITKNAVLKATETTTFPSGHLIKADANGKMVDAGPAYSQGTNITIDNNNKISATDTKYTGTAPITVNDTTHQIGVTVDSSLSTTSANPVQNSVISKNAVLKATETTTFPNGHLIKADANGKMIDAGPVYSQGANITIDNNNKISATDTHVPVDTALSTTSANPVQNSVISKNAVLKATDTTTFPSGHLIKADANGKMVDAGPVYSQGANITIDNNNKISATDTKYTGTAPITVNATTHQIGVTVDSSLNSTSTNPVQNKIIYDALNTKADKGNVAAATTPKVVTYTAQGIVTGGKDIVAGDNVTVGTDTATGNIKVSATDTKYTAGTNVTIDANNKISATDTKYIAGDHISIDNANKISATGLLSGVTATQTGAGFIIKGVTASGGTITVNHANVQVPYGSQTAQTYVPLWVQ